MVLQNRGTTMTPFSRPLSRLLLEMTALMLIVNVFLENSKPVHGQDPSTGVNFPENPEPSPSDSPTPTPSPSSSPMSSSPPEVSGVDLDENQLWEQFQGSLEKLQGNLKSAQQALEELQTSAEQLQISDQQQRGNGRIRLVLTVFFMAISAVGGFLMGKRSIGGTEPPRRSSRKRTSQTTKTGEPDYNSNDPDSVYVETAQSLQPRTIQATPEPTSPNLPNRPRQDTLQSYPTVSQPNPSYSPKQSISSSVNRLYSHQSPGNSDPLSSPPKPSNPNPIASLEQQYNQNSGDIFGRVNWVNDITIDDRRAGRSSDVLFQTTTRGSFGVIQDSQNYYLIPRDAPSTAEKLRDYFDIEGYLTYGSVYLQQAAVVEPLANSCWRLTHKGVISFR